VTIKNHKDLDVWNVGMELAEKVYLVTKNLPKEELFGLVSQTRRAAVSIPSNIAEGNARSSSKEYVQFLSIARGSCAELETQLLLCARLNLLSNDDSVYCLELVHTFVKGSDKKINHMSVT